MDEPRTFREGVLGGRESIKSLKVVATDGGVGRVSWASYAPGESYLVVSSGFLSRRHHVVPAGAVTSVGEGEVRVALSRAQVKELPVLSHPTAPIGDETAEQMINAFQRAAAFARHS